MGVLFVLLVNCVICAINSILCLDVYVKYYHIVFDEYCV